MKVVVAKEILESILTNAQSYLEKKDLSQITSHVLINANNDELEIKATDFEIGYAYKTRNAQIAATGYATANGSKLLQIIKSFKNIDVTLETINNSLYIKQNSSKFKLPMFNYLEFPSFPEIENKPKFDINAEDFSKAIKKITPAIDNNNPKFELNGALIDIKNNFVNFVATDTRRLAVFKKERQIDQNFSLIIPKKAIVEFGKLFFQNIEIFYDENTLIAKSEDFTFFGKLINGKFPDYERIIPKEKHFRIQLNREKMVESIKQIAIISIEVKITFKQKNITFESLNDENIEAKTEIDFETGLEEEINLSFNSKYILDFLSSIEESNFVLGYNDTNMPFTLEAKDFITIVMPIIK
ncbi:MAG: DNA polymerase III subunit beta [Campylobacteraceae bacterium]|jgi:DNA polymerase-3 subunit beta|nr:DNA polymerase III subunit beta [Campylobacteraceae bacterium]